MITSWASYQIRKIAGCACAGNAGNVFPRRRFQMKPVVRDPGMHHGTCVTHVPWCMSGSLTCGDGENVPGIPGACAPAILCIWQEAHVRETLPAFLALHYNDVIMEAIASQITSFTIVYSCVYSDADQSRHQSSASLAFVWEIHRDWWISRTNGQ